MHSDSFHSQLWIAGQQCDKTNPMLLVDEDTTTAPRRPEAKNFRRQGKSKTIKSQHAKRRKGVTEVVGIINPQKAHLSPNTLTCDPFVKFPIDMTAGNREFLHNLFIDPRPMSQYLRNTHFANGMVSPAAFYPAMALVAVGMHTAHDTPENARLYYQKQELVFTTKALSLVRGILGDVARIKTNKGLLDAVGTLLTYSLSKNDGATAAIHFNALERILEIRRGTKFQEPDLQFDDLRIACTWDTKPRPQLPEYSHTSAAPFWSTLPDVVRQITSTLRQNFPTLDHITILFEEVALFSAALNNIHRPQDLTSIHFCQHASISHRLVSLLSRHCSIKYFDDDVSVLSEVIRLSLVIFMTSTGKIVNGHRFMSSAEQLRKLREILERCTLNWDQILDLKVWVVALAFVEADADDDIKWFMELWKKTLRESRRRSPHTTPPSFFPFEDFSREVLEANGWGQADTGGIVIDTSIYSVPKAVSSIIWIDAIHGKRYREIIGRNVGSSELLPFLWNANRNESQLLLMIEASKQHGVGILDAGQ